MRGDEFRVLFVCTANICRSPMAEGLVREAVRRSSRPDADEVVGESAGVAAREGAPMEPRAVTALRDAGGDPGGFRARALRPAMVLDADLVLTASRDHRAEVLAQEPSAMGRTFTMLEFARLVRDARDAGMVPDPYDTGLGGPLGGAADRRVTGRRAAGRHRSGGEAPPRDTTGRHRGGDRDGPAVHNGAGAGVDDSRAVHEADDAAGRPDSLGVPGVGVRAASLVTAAASRRGQSPAIPAGGDDLPDPYGDPEDGFAVCVRQLVTALDWVYDLLVAKPAP